MNIRKRKTEHPFTITPNELINHPTLSAEAKFLVIYIESKPESWKARSFDMRRALGKWDEEKKERKAIGREKFSGIMKELVAAGYAELKAVRSEDGKTLKGKEYEIGCTQKDGFSGSLVSRQSEKQTVGKSSHIVKKEDYKGKSNKKDGVVEETPSPSQKSDSAFSPDLKEIQCIPWAMLRNLDPDEADSYRDAIRKAVDETNPRDLIALSLELNYRSEWQFQSLQMKYRHLTEDQLYLEINGAADKILDNELGRMQEPHEIMHKVKNHQPRRFAQYFQNKWMPRVKFNA